MEYLSPREEMPEVYPFFIPEAGRNGRVRGPGKYLWCAREALKAMGLGGRVWVKAGRVVTKEYFSRLILEVPDFISFPEKNRYELFSTKDGSESSNRPFFGDYSFAETVGLWLEKGHAEASNLLSPFISTEGFVFSPEEYLDLLERLKGALRRYEKLPAVSNGLEDLNTGFFRHRSLEESTSFIQKHLAAYLKRGAGLHRRFLLAINQHARSEANAKRRELRSRTSLLETLKSEILVVGELAGRSQKKAFNEAVALWETYRKDYPGASEETPAVTGVESLRIAVDREAEKVSATFNRMARTLKTDGMSLNALTVNPLHGDADLLLELEGALNELLREVDEAGLYQLPLRLTDAATTPRQLQQLDSLLDKLRNTQRHMGELPMFYDRRHFWYAQPAHLRRLLAPLLDLPHQDWETAFSSWYFERCLEREQRPQRFFNGVLIPLNNSTPNNKLPVLKTENLTFLAPEDSWPTNTSANDLLLDLSGANELNGNQPASYYSVAPLSDTSAMHLVLSGYRNPALVFSQSFQLLHPPRWRVRKAEAPPAGTKNSVLIQLNENTPWVSLEDWGGGKADEINLFFPQELNSKEEKVLLGCWESLIHAAPVITYFHALSPNEITQGLLSDGLNGSFLISVLLRAAEAAELIPFDHEALIALGSEVRIRCGLPNPAPHPLAVEFGAVLADKLPGYFVETHVPWRDTFLPLMIQSPSGKKSVLLPNGRLPGLADEATETARHLELETAGFQVLMINALEVWENLAGEVERLSNEVKLG